MAIATVSEPLLRSHSWGAEILGAGATGNAFPSVILHSAAYVSEPSRSGFITVKWLLEPQVCRGDCSVNSIGSRRNFSQVLIRSRSTIVLFRRPDGIPGDTSSRGMSGRAGRSEWRPLEVKGASKLPG
jgi:hypothetical protein